MKSALILAIIVVANVCHQTRGEKHLVCYHCSDSAVTLPNATCTAFDQADEDQRKKNPFKEDCGTNSCGHTRVGNETYRGCAVHNDCDPNHDPASGKRTICTCNKEDFCNGDLFAPKDDDGGGQQPHKNGAPIRTTVLPVIMTFLGFAIF